jgi:hypothetical protein
VVCEADHVGVWENTGSGIVAATYDFCTSPLKGGSNYFLILSEAKDLSPGEP